MRILLAFVLLLTSFLCAQESSAKFTTIQLMNGRAWQQFDDEAKIMYLSGVRDSLIYFSVTAQHQVDANELMQAKWAPGFIVGDYINELDAVYRSRENILIPIVNAMDYCTVKLKGQTSRAELEQMLMTLRKIAATASVK